MSQPTTNEKIAAAAWRAATGQLAGLPSKPGLCLALVRFVVEAALDWPSHDLYRRFLVAGTTRRPGSEVQRLRDARRDPWASDLERSAKILQWGVPFAERQPGDLVFNHEAALPYGHVGVLVTRDLLLENISPVYRPDSVLLPNSLALTLVESRAWTLCARLPEGGDT